VRLQRHEGQVPAGEHHRHLSCHAGGLRSYRMVSKSDATVLLRGESGTGKELVHTPCITTRDAPATLYQGHCAALPRRFSKASFRSRAGAFTGAVAQRKGRFELADGGPSSWTRSGPSPHHADSPAARAAGEGVRARGARRYRQDRRRVITATTATWKDSSPRDNSARTSTIVLTFSPSTCRRCASARPTSRCWPTNFVEKYSKANHKVRAEDFHPGHRHAHELPLARQRPRSWRTVSSAPLVLSPMT